MLRKKQELELTTTAGLETLTNFQAAVDELHKFNPATLDMNVLETIATKYNVDINLLANSFKTFLKKNAIEAISEIKKSNLDYTVITLETEAEKFGFEFEELNLAI